MIQDQAVGEPKEDQGEPKKKVKIVNFVRKTAQVPALEQVKPNENSSTRRETKKSSEKQKRMNKSALIKRPPRIRQERNDITSKSAEHSLKSRSERTAQRSVHSTAFKSIVAGSFTLEASVPDDVHPLPPPVALTKKPRRERSIFEDERSSSESKKKTMIDEMGPRQAIIEEAPRVEQGKSTKEKKVSKIIPEKIKEGEKKKLSGIEEVELNNTGGGLSLSQLQREISISSSLCNLKNINP